jgi:DNA-directed RNA polymerase specialized sigma subunit
VEAWGPRPARRIDKPGCRGKFARPGRQSRTGQFGHYVEDIRTGDGPEEDSFYHEEQSKPPKLASGEEPTVFDRASFGAGGKPGVGSVNINPQVKQAKRDWLEAELAEAILDGIKITRCPDGKRPNFRFGRSRPPAGMVGTSRDNDLSRKRWRTPILSFEEERDLIRDTRSGDKRVQDRAKNRLYQSFHRTILKIASKYSGPTHVELMAAGSLGFWEAVERFDLTRNRGRLRTYADSWIRKHILKEIERWNKGGDRSDTRADRWVYSHPNATAEEVVAAVGGSLHAAEAAIQRAEAHNSESYDTTEEYEDENGNDGPAQHGPSQEARKHFGCFNDCQLSPQLLHHEPAGRHRPARDMLSGRYPRWPGLSRVVDHLAEYHSKETWRRLNKIGRQAYALELVERDTATPRSDESRYRYRGADEKERLAIALRCEALAARRHEHRGGGHRPAGELWLRKHKSVDLRTAAQSQKYQVATSKRADDGTNWKSIENDRLENIYNQIKRQRNWKADEKEKLRNDRQIGKRGDASPGIRGADLGRGSDRSRRAARPRIDQLHLQTGIAGRSPPARPAGRKGLVNG